MKILLSKEKETLKMGQKNCFGKLIGFLVIIGIIAVVITLLSIFGGALMKVFGFTYESTGSVVLFFVLSGIFGFPLELIVKEVPRALFLRFNKINEFQAKLLFVVLDASLSMIILSLVDHYMNSVSATPTALIAVSVIMALICMGDVTEDEEI